MNLKIAQISDPEYVRMVENDNETAMDEAINDFVTRCELTVTSDMVAPISKGEIIGRLKYLDQSASRSRRCWWPTGPSRNSRPG